MVNFQPKSTAQVEKKRADQKDLRQAQFWHSHLGYFPGSIDHVRGEKTNDRHTLEPSAVSGPSPPLCGRWYFFTRTEILSNDAILAESHGFSTHRN